MCRRVLMMAAGLGCALALVGCESGVKRVPVSGEVTLDGKPLSQGVLMFSPDGSKGNTARVGCTGAVSKGRFNLVTTGISKADTGTGAPVGWFKVTYFHPDEGSLKAGVETPKVAAKYQHEDSTPVSIELTDPPPAEGYKIELRSK